MSLIIIILLFVAPLSVCGLLLIYYTIHEIKSNWNKYNIVKSIFKMLLWYSIFKSLDKIWIETCKKLHIMVIFDTVVQDKQSVITVYRI